MYTDAWSCVYSTCIFAGFKESSSFIFLCLYFSMLSVVILHALQNLLLSFCMLHKPCTCSKLPFQVKFWDLLLLWRNSCMHILCRCLRMVKSFSFSCVLLIQVSALRALALTEQFFCSCIAVYPLEDSALLGFYWDLPGLERISHMFDYNMNYMHIFISYNIPTCYYS